ncbi:hypothetical protein ACFVHQ_18215 [Actinomycetes bacterium NPDC127524]
MEFQKITHEEEKSFPAFNNHLEAREYFKQYYMDHFTYKNKKEKGGQEIFSYVLVLNAEAYRSGQEKLARFEMVDGTDFSASFQTIDIYEDGGIYIYR